ncbi:tail fiber protein [Alteromonas sp. ASW11-19]|uniref:Tail fiber protein n=1 Tax=Alteromonas salexigens TaxID=2982530 RepID=A0ABT2VSI3_9ALTE|nr:tail fiber protein [Alteromonas salexigens]MCU7555878.1 tail fiber protein [Alteromonas salexigens]
MRKLSFVCSVALAAASLQVTAPAVAEPLLGEIRFVGFNFAPRGWAECDGQLLPISQNSALFSILGTIYGGDGRTTFALPDMRGRTPVHAGSGPGLSSYTLGARTGTESNRLTLANMPPHHHHVQATNSSARTSSPASNTLARTRSNGRAYVNEDPNVTLHPSSIAETGTAAPVDNMQPFTTLNCIIATQGLFPSRN